MRLGTKLTNQAINFVLASVFCCLVCFFVFNSKPENIQKKMAPRHHPDISQGNMMLYATGNTTYLSETEEIELTHYCKIYDLNAKNSHDFQCVIMKLEPPTPICLHDITKDIFISKSLATGDVYEVKVLSELADILKTDPNMGLIDIGGNIGIYSLFAAQSNHNVVTVEPFMENIIRFHKAAQLGNTTNKITLVQNAVADKHQWATFIKSENNQGATRIKLSSGKECEGDCSNTVNTIFLDDLLEVINFKTAVMKIDCEGYEHIAFSHAEKLLNHVDIKAIFMEFAWMKMWYRHINTKGKVLVEDMIALLKRKGFRPHETEKSGGADLSRKSWNSWPWLVVWHHTTP